MKVQNTDIAKLADGAIIERLNDELKVVIANIQDINTKQKHIREVNLSLKIKPGEDREACNYEIHTSCKLAPQREVAGTIYVGKEADAFVAYESAKEKATENTEELSQTFVDTENQVV